MYHDINSDAGRPVDSFDEWASSFDAWLDTTAGAAWLDAESDAAEMRVGAEHYNIRPGFFGGCHANR
jgi:hypothetical protein